MSSYHQTKAMKHFKRSAVFLLAVFFTFAPPGTLIFGAILLVWLIGNVWVTVGGVFSLALVAALLIRRKYRQQQKARTTANTNPNSARLQREGSLSKNRDTRTACDW